MTLFTLAFHFAFPFTTGLLNPLMNPPMAHENLLPSKVMDYLLPRAFADFAEKTDTADSTDYIHTVYKGKPDKKENARKCLVGDVELDIVGGRCAYKSHQGRCQPGEFECGPVFSHVCVSTSAENISMRCSEAYGMKLLKNNIVATPSKEYYMTIREGVQGRYKKYCDGNQIKYVDACAAYTGVITKVNNRLNRVIAVGFSAKNLALPQQSDSPAASSNAPTDTTNKAAANANSQSNTQANTQTTAQFNTQKPKVNLDDEEFIETDHSAKNGYKITISPIPTPSEQLCRPHLEEFKSLLELKTLDNTTDSPSFRTAYLETLSIWQRYEDIKARCQTANCNEFLASVMDIPNPDVFMIPEFELYMRPASADSPTAVAQSVAQDIRLFGDLMNVSLRIALTPKTRKEAKDIDTLNKNRGYNLNDPTYLEKLKNAYLQDDTFEKVKTQTTTPSKPSSNPLVRLISERIQGADSPYLSALLANEEKLRELDASLEYYLKNYRQNHINTTMNSCSDDTTSNLPSIKLDEGDDSIIPPYVDVSHYKTDTADLHPLKEIKEIQTLVQDALESTDRLNESLQIHMSDMLNKLQEMPEDCLGSQEVLDGLSKFNKESKNENSLDKK